MKKIQIILLVAVVFVVLTEGNILPTAKAYDDPARLFKFDGSGEIENRPHPFFDDRTIAAMIIAVTVAIPVSIIVIYLMRIEKNQKKLLKNQGRTVNYPRENKQPANVV